MRWLARLIEREARSNEHAHQGGTGQCGHCGRHPEADGARADR
ncbi:hypothetical protein [Nonomuraea sp. bgisy101]